MVLPWTEPMEQGNWFSTRLRPGCAARPCASPPNLVNAEGDEAQPNLVRFIDRHILPETVDSFGGFQKAMAGIANKDAQDQAVADQKRVREEVAATAKDNREHPETARSSDQGSGSGYNRPKSKRRGGRPSKADRKVNQTLRLDPDVPDTYKREGPGLASAHEHCCCVSTCHGMRNNVAVALVEQQTSRRLDDACLTPVRPLMLVELRERDGRQRDCFALCQAWPPDGRLRPYKVGFMVSR
jgi:uncharacterized protein (DUF4415 family)